MSAGGTIPQASAALELHAHLLPPKRNASLMRWAHRAMPDCPIPVDITVEQAIEDLRGAGAQTIVNLLFPLQAGEADELHAWGAQLTAANPDIVPLGGVHAEDADPAGVVRRAIEDHGMHGLKLHPMVQRFSPGHPALVPALGALAEYGLPLYVHTGFDEFYGWGFDVGELGAIAERHPEIPLVLCHSNFPRFAWAAQLARRHAQVWLDTTNSWAASEDAPAEQRAQLRAGLAGLFEAAPNRVVFGTDYPAGMGTLHDLHACAAELAPEGVDAPARMLENGRRLLGLMRG
jgi:predicted TIM-barrel fold metal-dependent hydrolase